MLVILDKEGLGMCKIFETTRAFVLKPEMLGQQGARLSIIEEFERIQKGYDNELEILFRKDGGFIICLPDTFTKEDLIEATLHLADFLETSPRLIDRTRLC